MLRLDNRSYETNAVVILLLNDMHQEYPPPEVGVRRAGFARVRVVWDTYRIETACVDAEEENVQEIGNRLFPGFEYDVACVYMLEGTIAELEATRTSWLRDLASGPSGGDDDTFDYWPNTMDIIEEMSRDLDGLDGTTVRMDELRELYRELIATSVYKEFGDELWKPRGV